MATQRAIVVFGVVAWLASAAILWITGSPLGDNEAIYATAARLHLAGEPTQWNYLSKGMTAVAAPGLWLGADERALRVVPVLLGITFVLAGALLARRAVGGVVAAWFPAIAAATWSMARRSADLLGDLPAAACLLAGIAIAISELRRDDGPRWPLIVVAPLFAAAFYVRYGSCLPIAIIGVAALGFGWRAVRQRPAPAIATLVVFVVLLIPHALDARATTGSALGFLRDGNAVLGVDYVGVGLVGFLTQNPFAYYGVVTTPLLILGLCSIVRPRDRWAVMLWLIAVADIVAIGLTTVAESRYIFLALALLLVLGADLAHRLISSRRGRLRDALGYVAAVAIAVSAASVVVLESRLGRVRRLWDGILVASAAVRRDAGGAACQVVARHSSQVVWYSGCLPFVEGALNGRLVYVVRDGVGVDQPGLTGLPGHPRTLLDDGGVEVVRLEP